MISDSKLTLAGHTKRHAICFPRVPLSTVKLCAGRHLCPVLDWVAGVGWDDVFLDLDPECHRLRVVGAGVADEEALLQGGDHR
jgi:hypothetical protein